MTAHILVVEDDEKIAEVIQDCLTAANYEVEVVHSAEAGSAMLSINSYNLLILDWQLPKASGLDLCTEARAKGINTPVLFLTGMDSVGNKMAGLDSGADDYLVKPFERDELMARLRSLLRRAEKSGQKDGVITFGDICMNVAEHSITYCNVPVNLSRREYTLLHVLLAKPGKVFSREKLQQAIYSWDDDIASNTVDVHIHNIRKKFYPEVIKTLRGVGYVAAEKNADAKGDT